MDILNIVLSLIVILFSVIIHEVSHGVVAGWFGDDTAKEEGRITLNPIPHLDPIMSIALPLILAATHSPVFGAAKPVPVNYSRMLRPRLGLALVSLAGPLSNFIISIVAIILLYVGLPNLIPGSDIVLSALVVTNFLLGVFNLLPIPPLDGSRVVASVLPQHWMNVFFTLDRFGFFILFALIYMGSFNSIMNLAYNFLLRILGA